MRRTRMSPMSAKQRAKRATEGDQFPVSTFRPAKPVMKAASRPAQTGPDQATVDAVVDRDLGCCVVCGDGVAGKRGVHWSIHHRKLRSQGGDNRLSNLVLTCGHGTVACHGEIHDNPEKAREGGWMLRRGDDPEAKPVAHSQFGWALLDNEGGWVRAQPPYDPMTAALPAGGGPF